MIAYRYNEQNIYIGQEEAFIDPLESKNAGKDVFVLPADCTFVAPLSDKDGFVQKWNGSAWEYVANHIGQSGYLNGKQHEIKEYGPLPAGFQTKEEWEAGSLDRLLENLPAAKSTITDKLDQATSTAILAGFDYSHNGETLHFSYDRDDQQNFSDTANACLLIKMSNSNTDRKVTWNAYTSENELVRLELNPDEFLDLYNAALNHKETNMMEGGKRKALIRDANSADEIKTLLKEWNINL